VSVHGLGGRYSERARRDLTQIPGADLVRWGLVGEPPEDAEGYEIRPGLKVPKWPTRYLTAEIVEVANLHRLAMDGMPPRRDGTGEWPASLVEAFALLSAEKGLVGRG